MTDLNRPCSRAPRYKNCSPVNERLWCTISNDQRDFSINVRSFLWKLLHGAHKCGLYWSKIVNYEEHGMCANCEMVETMNHILFECKVNQGPQIWKSAKEICERKHIPWP